MIRSVLVPLDGSSFAEHALPFAVTIARQAKASLSLILVHMPLAAVYSEMQLALDTIPDTELKKREETYLTSVLERIKSVADVPVRATLKEGAVIEAIRQQAEAGGADLVVMTTHGRGAFARFWLGSVADGLLRKLSVPLLLVKPREGLADLRTAPALRHILIPLDGSPLAEQVIELAVTLGRLAEADYTLMRVVKPAMPLSIDYIHTPLTVHGEAMLDALRQIHEQEMKAAEAYLHKVTGSLKGRLLAVESRVVSAEQPAAAILEETAQTGVQMIALASRGRSGLGRLFLGSVADKLVRGSGVPVLVYHPREK